MRGHFGMNRRDVKPCVSCNDVTCKIILEFRCKNLFLYFDMEGKHCQTIGVAIAFWT